MGGRKGSATAFGMTDGMAEIRDEREPHSQGEEKRDFSPAQADRFAGAKREEKVGLLRSK